ncbi:MAG: wax ester/triacylglycerol synthase family O-acyltransferase [Caldilineaceae bacterium]|nr:wax ester/triacylglycerol synthase family O-acyltransferase [Caldilineaceae bacterium]
MTPPEPMSSVDRAWLMMDDPTNPMVINGFWIFKEMLAYEDVLAVLEARLLIHERFRQRVVQRRGPFRTRAYWETDPRFAPRAHVGRVLLPPPGDRRTLNDTMARLLTVPLDLERPLWAFTLIQGYQGGSVFFGRIHHCIGDGAALVRVLLSLADLSAEGEWRAPAAGAGLPKEIDALRPPARPRRALPQEDGRRGGKPAALLSLAARGAGLAGKFAATLAKLALMRTDDKTAFKGDVGVGKAVAWSEGIPLDDVKFVKNRMGATVNDVLVAAMAGALRQYVEARGGDPEGKEIRAMVPVDIRGPEDTKLTNRFALVYLPLPIGIAAPVDRLYETKRHMDAIKRSPEALVTYRVIAGLGVVSDKIARRVRAYYADKVSVVLTNVPGPPQRLYFAGKALDTIVFWVPQSGSIGVGISIFSYGGQVNVGLITDRGLAPDPDTIIAAFEAEFDSLLCLARARDGGASLTGVTARKAGLGAP